MRILLCFCLCCFAVGCGEAKPRSVLDGADPAAIQAYKDANYSYEQEMTASSEEAAKSKRMAPDDY